MCLWNDEAQYQWFRLKMNVLFSCVNTHMHSHTHTVSTLDTHTHQQRQIEWQKGRGKEKLREAVSQSMLLLVFSTGTKSQWNMRSLFFSPPSSLCPSPSFSVWRQTQQQQHTQLDVADLQNLITHVNSPLPHNQLCNTGGSHYVSIFALLWPQPVYYTINHTPYFQFAKVLPLYVVCKRHLLNKDVRLSDKI